MKTKKLIALSLCSALCVGSLALSFSPVSASADTLTSNDTALDEWGYLDSDNVALYNPFGPFRFNYYSDYSHLVYGVDIPDSYGGPPNPWTIDGSYGVLETLDYSNNMGMFGVAISDFSSNANVPCINFQMNSNLFWLDSFEDWYFMTDVPCNISLFVWYDTPEGERTYTVHAQDYAEWELNDNAYSLSVYEMLAGFSSEVEDVYGFLGDDGSCVVRDFVITLTPTEELTQLLTLPLHDEEDTPITLTRYYVYKHTYLGGASSPEPIPDDFFGWIFDAVGTFLDTEFLPDVSFGKLMLIALGFVVFGLGIKIAFGG